MFFVHDICTWNWEGDSFSGLRIFSNIPCESSSFAVIRSAGLNTSIFWRMSRNSISIGALKRLSNGVNPLILYSVAITLLKLLSLHVERFSPLPKHRRICLHWASCSASEQGSNGTSSPKSTSCLCFVALPSFCLNYRSSNKMHPMLHMSIPWS